MKIREFAIKVLAVSNEPLNYKQILEKGNELGLQLDYQGNNTLINIYSTINQDITTHGDNSVFIKLSSNPVLFGLAEKKETYSKDSVEKAIKKEVKEEVSTLNARNKKTDYNECDLHPLLVMYLSGNEHFLCHTKTIVQQEGNKAPKGIDKWRYPDLIGVCDIGAAKDYADCTLSLMNKNGVLLYKVFSFEMKIGIDRSNAREEYFQAVSNSSWANEGYLVAAEIDENDSLLMKDLSLLNSSFGIGIIHLDITHPSESKVLYFSKERDVIDFGALNVLINRSGAEGAVTKVFDYISERTRRARPENLFDEILDDETFQERTKNVGIKGLSGRKK